MTQEQKDKMIELAAKKYGNEETLEYDAAGLMNIYMDGHVDGYEQGYKDAIEKACKLLYKKCGFFDLEIDKFKEIMEEQ